MAKTTTRVANYGKKYKQFFLELLSDTTTRITLPDEIDGVQYSLGKERWDGDTNLEYIDFNKCDIIPARTCAECTNLAQAVFSAHTTEIGDYAFYNCQKFEDTELPHTVTNIGQYAFYQAGSGYAQNTHTFSFIDDQGVETSIGNYGFSSSHLSDLEGTFINVGQYAISGCSSLTKVRLSFDDAAIDSYAFNGCAYVNDFEYDKNSKIKTLGTYAFRTWGYSRSSTDYFLWDMTKAGFDSVPACCWSLNKYSVILLPSKVTTINTYAFENNDHLILYLNSLPTLSSTNGFQNNTNLQIVVNYMLDETILQSMTNWTTYASNIVSGIAGYVGVLPPYTDDTGVAITWYSDSSHTTEVTTSSSASDVFYAVKGNERLVWHANTTTVDASVTISDGSVTYGSFIPVNTTVTITPNYTDPTKNQLFAFKVNGVDYTSAGTATIQVTEDLSIIALYWNGTDQPFMPTMSDNDWNMIKVASKLGAVPSTWYVGDTKTFTYDGVDYTARLVDKTGKFTRVADGSTAYLSFEVTELLPDSEVYNSSWDNRPTQSQLLAKMNTGEIWDKVDPSLRSALEDVNVLVSQGGGSSTEGTLINWTGKLFLPREHDFCSLNSLSTVHSVQSEWDSITQDQYYQDHDTYDARHKAKKSSPSTAITYWEMSPCTNSSYNVCIIWPRGTANADRSTYNYGVALRFAL